MAVALAVAEDNLEDCKVICRGEDPDDQCYDDGDCDSDEYCWKGVAGIGENECMVCRPADKCN